MPPMLTRPVARRIVDVGHVPGARGAGWRRGRRLAVVVVLASSTVSSSRSASVSSASALRSRRAEPAHVVPSLANCCVVEGPRRRSHRSSRSRPHRGRSRAARRRAWKTACSTRCTTSWAMRSPRESRTGVGGVVVDQQHLDLAAVAGVDRARRVDDADTEACGQPGARVHERGVAVGQRDRDARSAPSPAPPVPARRRPRSPGRRRRRRDGRTRAAANRRRAAG